ncbi:MAG: outer membrane protein assembly factor BamA [Rhizobiales bacterium]|nr:outer membrane protein assembly factor BamA [Hyphomicrobiales bacterium]
MKKLILNFFILYTAIFAAFDSIIVHAEDHIINKIFVEGNNRIDAETVINYSGILLGDSYNETQVDASLKKLYETDLFSNVEIKYSNSILTIEVSENYLINQVAFEGNKKLDDQSLESITSLKPRSTFSNKKLEEDISRIINSYRAAGRYSVYVEPKVIKLDFNRINLIYEINEGNVTKITDINFIGNVNFSDRKLRNAIASKRSTLIDGIWGTGRSYDNLIMEYDKELLEQFYRNNGYVNFKVINSVAELDGKKDSFIITFTVEEGERYNFGSINITNEINYSELNKISDNIKTITGDVYSEKAIQTSNLQIVDYLRNNGLPFVQVNAIEKFNNIDKTIDINYVLSSGPRVYVERIDISGNQRTFDNVIRRELVISEGDPLNQEYINKSIRNIRNLGLFNDVKVNTVPGSSFDKRILKISISETNTGSLVFGAGYSSLGGVLGTVKISESNLLGKGQNITLDLSYGADQSLANINFTEPRFLDTPISAGFDLYGNDTDYSETSGYKNRQVGAGVRFGFPLSEELRLSLKYNNINNEVYSVPTTASTALRQLEGKRNTSEFGYLLSYNTLDNNFSPTNGLKLNLSQDLAGLGGDVKYLRSELSSNYYIDFTKDVVGSMSLNLGHIFGLDDQKVLISDAFKDPGTKIRGFQFGGISPRLKASVANSNEEAIGGNTYISASTGLKFPIPTITEEYGISGGLHLNAGTVFGSDHTPVTDVNESNSIRTSAGVSVFWDSPIGPLRFDFTEVINKETFDRTEFFQFSGGTSF